MSSLLDESPGQVDAARDRLRSTMAAMRLAFTWFGTRKTLTTDQRAQAAESFGAEGDSLSAGKKLLDTRHPKFKAVTAVRNQAVQYWRALSLPYPEPGIRLIRQRDVEAAAGQMGEFREELGIAVGELNSHYGELKTAARRRLGQLFSAQDYPATLQGLFDLQWDFPAVEPPAYLRQLSPDLYRQECARVQARFDEAVQMAEQAFLEELDQLVSHLTERLSGGDDGKPKIFRDSAVANLTEFFERFRRLNIGSSDELDALVSQAQQVVRGVRPQQLRDDGSLRQQISTQLAGVQSVLDGLLVDRPRRAILRRSR